MTPRALYPADGGPAAGEGDPEPAGRMRGPFETPDRPGAPGLPTSRDGAGGDSTVVLAAHGSRDPDAAPVVQAIARSVGDRLSARVEVGWLSTGEPTFTDLATGVAADVVVPLLLGTGYHVLVDIPRGLAGRDAVRPTTGPAHSAGAGTVGADRPAPVVTPHLGPAGEVVRALADRVRAVDPEPVAVVLAAAGTSHPVGRSETRQAGDLLSQSLGVPVRVAYAAGAGPDIAEAVLALRESGARRVTVVPYLLAPGFFADRIRAAAGRAGAAAAEVLADHPQIAALVVRRVMEASAAVPPVPASRAA